MQKRIHGATGFTRDEDCCSTETAHPGFSLHLPHVHQLARLRIL